MDQDRDARIALHVLGALALRLGVDKYVLTVGVDPGELTAFSYPTAMYNLDGFELCPARENGERSQPLDAVPRRSRNDGGRCVR